MSFNKAKAMRNAERYLTQGKIQAAISEYRQIVDQDPKDINTQNMLGDLYTKAGDDAEAVKCYKDVAEYYNGQGFAKKAIAIYNKIHRIEPDSLEVSSKLADLYRTRGSYAEAKKHYEMLAEHYESKGQRAEALAMWENIAELDPRNAEIYLKIAESYWRDGRENEASDSFIKAGKRLSDCGNHESAVTAFSRALEITPLEFSAIEGLVRSQITLGYPEEAAKALQLRIENDPYDKGTNFLLVECYYDIGDAAAAERVIVKMVEREPSNYPEFLELIDVYFKNDDLDSVVRIMCMIAEHMLVGGEHDALLVLIEEVLARNPEHIGALRLLARYHAWLKDEGELKAALERVAESARIGGFEEDELFALSQLSILAPHDTEVSSRLQALGANGDSSSHFQTLQTGEVPDFESYAPLSKSGEGSEAGSPNGENGNRDQTPDNAAETGFAFESFDKNAAGEQTLQAEVVSEHEHETDSENAHTGVPGTGLNTAETTSDNVVIDQHGAQDAAESGSPDGNQQPNEDYDPTKLSASDELKLEEETESIRFYLEQGYHGLADKSLCELEIEFGRRPELVELREALSGTEFAKSAIPPESPKKVTGELTPPEAVDAAGQPENVESAEEESDVQSAQSGVELEQQTAQPGLQDVTEPVSHAPEQNTAESSDSGVEAANADIQTEVSEQGDLENDLTNSFESLKDELGFSEADNDGDDDYENHYHHAVAYKEMGLTEEAIREFQHAVNGVSPDDGTKRYLSCCTLLGDCFMEKGMPNLGVVWFRKAFEVQNLDTEEQNGIRYELASALETGGDFEEAMEEFEKIYTVDVDFRDVGKRIERLADKLPVPA